MPAEITMPQLSDTMTEGTLVKWVKKEGDKVKAGEVVAEIETDKATMEMETSEAGVLAALVAQPGQKIKVGGVIAALATGKDDPAEVKKQYAGGSPAAAAAPAAGAAAPAPKAPAPPPGSPAVPEKKGEPAKAAAAPTRIPPQANKQNYQFDIVVIGGGPAGYAAAIRAGQLKKRVLCIEKENLGGTCLNWGCIPTKALLEDGAFIRHLKHAQDRGVTVGNVTIDFGKIIGRSRSIADKLAKGIGHLFRKHEVKHEVGVGSIVGPHKVKITGKDGSKDVTADHVIIATGARATQLPFAPFDRQRIITSREAMNLPKQPKKLAIIGGGVIGCEFADFYSAIGTEVTIVEMLPHLLPNEEEDVSKLLEKVFEKRGVKLMLKHKTEKVETTGAGVKLTVTPAEGGAQAAVEADVVLVAVGVSGNTEGLGAEQAKLALDRGRVKVDHEYRTNLENVWAVGDVISMHWPEQMAMGGYRHPDLAHVAHHEAVLVVERICGIERHDIDYRNIPGCTYTHPQVASMGATEKKLREQGREIRVGKFPFSVSGRALAAGETDGFVKLIFDAKYGELLGVHMIGENVTEMLSELVLARKLEATEEEILDAIHPHPTMSEAVMEAAGASVGKAIHI